MPKVKKGRKHSRAAREAGSGGFSKGDDAAEEVGGYGGSSLPAKTVEDAEEGGEVCESNGADLMQ